MFNITKLSVVNYNNYNHKWQPVIFSGRKGRFFPLRNFQKIPFSGELQFPFLSSLVEPRVEGITPYHMGCIKTGMNYLPSGAGFQSSTLWLEGDIFLGSDKFSCRDGLLILNSWEILSYWMPIGVNHREARCFFPFGWSTITWQHISTTAWNSCEATGCPPPQ